jgi:ligand-binding sensor domain-containing protein/DNA-binding CsgD family transcriptional regulator
LEKPRYIFSSVIGKPPEGSLNAAIFQRLSKVFLSLIIIPLVLISFFVNAQVKTTGTPYIQNYPKLAYGAGTQNWGIAQDKNGLMYFANNNGVLRFDGTHWDLIPVSGTSPVRSLAIDDDNNIYVGLINDFGVLEQNSTGIVQYKSLRHLLPAGIDDFDDVWKTYNIQGNLFFQSYENLFVLQNGQIQVIRPQSRFHFSFHVNNRLLLYEPDSGIYEYRNGNLDKVPWSDNFTGKEIREILEVQRNHLLIATDRDGIYTVENGKLEKWNVPVSAFSEEYILLSAAKIGESFFAFGTIANGVVISDSDGNIIQHLNKNRRLQNNTVLSLFADHDENLWLGLDNGIDYIETNSPLSYISDFEGLGAGYCAQVFDGNLYLGTNQGLYVKSFNQFSYNNEPFELVENTTGQVWSLKIFDDQLFCGHNAGTFIIQGNKAVQISEEEGGWDYIKLNNREDLILGGHYNGLQIFSKNGSSWSHLKTIKGFNESSRFLFQNDDGTIWMSHGGKGVFRIHLNQELDSVMNYSLFTSSHGLPSDEQNIIFGYNNQIYISTVAGVYRFNAETSTFDIATRFTETFPFNGRLKTFVPDSEGNFWFITDHESGVFRLNEDLTYTKITVPFKPLENQFVNEFEFIYPFNNDHVFIGIENGFAHYSSKFLKSYNRAYQSIITKVELPNLDSTIVLLNRTTGNNFSFPYKKNAFRFHFAAPFFEGHSRLQFSYLLENYYDAWSGWRSDHYRDFTNLREGEYTFKLKARNIYGEESEISTFLFKITPPWYRSKLAYFLYLFLFGLILFLTFKFFSNRIKTLKRKEAEKHQKELKEREQTFQKQSLMAEKENIRLRNEKLTAEMQHRDKELANQTMSIIHKNELLVKLKEELQHLQKTASDGSVKTKLSALNRRINKEIDNEQQNQIFETYFEEVHKEFFKRIRDKYPDLTAREMKLSAYIRMNLTTKEIAVLLNISNRGVEIARYRLRKRFNLERETNLTTFLLNI